MKADGACAETKGPIQHAFCAEATKGRLGFRISDPVIKPRKFRPDPGRRATRLTQHRCMVVCLSLSRNDTDHETKPARLPWNKGKLECQTVEKLRPGELRWFNAVG